MSFNLALKSPVPHQAVRAFFQAIRKDSLIDRGYNNQLSPNDEHQVEFIRAASQSRLPFFYSSFILTF